MKVDQQGSCSAKKGSCSSQKGTKKRKVGSNDAKHAVGYKTKWESDFPWLLSEKNSEGEVIGMLCRLCKTGNKYNKTTVWSETPCVCMLEEGQCS